MDKVEVKILGGGLEVGRLSVALSRLGREETIVLDSGVNFDHEDRPVFAGHVPPRNVKAITVSHGHLDHIGTAPMYFISGNPRVYATRVTRQIAKLLLEDFLKLNGYYIPYEHREVQLLLESTTEVDFGEEVDADGASLKFYSAGHIPGSLITVVEFDGVRVAFTGDVNTVETKLMKPAQLDAIGKVDVLITEATYGSSLHPPRRKAEERLISIIEEVVDSGGTVLVPAFSVARGQEIMMVLAEKDLDVPVYVDGMIRQVTEIFLDNSKYVNNPSLLRKAYEEFYIVRGWQDRRRAWKQPGVIIASAGMLKGGPSLYYLKKLGQEPKNAIVMVSFQAPNSPGRRILEDGLMPDSEEPVRARVEWLDFSSHADRSGLLKVVESLKPSKLIIVHSEEDVAKQFAELAKSVGVDDVVLGENNTTYVIEE
ncbi:MAG: MBL fold metallo-hydrolase [Thermoproteota archaeon]